MVRQNVHEIPEHKHRHTLYLRCKVCGTFTSRSNHPRTKNGKCGKCGSKKTVLYRPPCCFRALSKNVAELEKVHKEIKEELKR